jgi:hypothetical protein
MILMLSYTSLVKSHDYNSLLENILAFLILFVLGIIIRFRKLFWCYKSRLGNISEPQLVSYSRFGETHGRLMHVLHSLECNSSRSSTFYHGHSWHHVCIVFAVRFVYLGLSVASLVYLAGILRVSSHDMANDSLILGFFILTIIKDIFMFSPIPDPARAISIFVIQIGQFPLVYFMKGYHIRVFALLISIYGMDYRDPRFIWSQVELRKSFKVKRAELNTVIVLTIFFFSVFGALITGMIVGTFQRSNVDNGPGFNYVPYDSGNFFNSPLCAMKFGKRPSLNIIDIATFSSSVYKHNRTAVLESIGRNPHLDDWTLGTLYNLDNTGVEYINDPEVASINVSAAIRFAEFVHKKGNLSVIAIRGTSKAEDIFQDMYMWSTVGLLQISSYFGTLINIWPIQTVAKVVYLISKYVSYPKLLYYEELEKIVAKMVDDKPSTQGTGADFLSLFFPERMSSGLAKSSRIMMTGHSLGGGLAAIIGAHLEIPAITFSSPGLGYSMLNYNVSGESLMTYTLNVVPMYDPVAALDVQVGTVLNLPCEAGQPIDCHSLVRAMKMMTQMCEM